MHFTTRDTSHWESSHELFQALTNFNVVVRITFTCMTITCMWYDHKCYYLMFAYNSFFMEINHAEFIRTIYRKPRPSSNEKIVLDSTDGKSLYVAAKVAN